MDLLTYFKENDRLRIETIAEQQCVKGNLELAKLLDQSGEIEKIPEGSEFIQQADGTKDVYFVLSGTCRILVNGRLVASRGSGQQVGEMAAIQPAQLRSATCQAEEDMLVLRVSGPTLEEIGDQFPQLYRYFSQDLARRLLERNKALPGFREKVRLFVICSVESLPIARAIQNAFEHDPINVVIWTDGVFKVSSYPIEALESELNNSDFAVAIAHSDDRTLSRDTEWPSPRDNVVFELGMFLGRLGRSRAILMEPREEKVKLPSDMAGVTTIPYAFSKNTNEVESYMGPACNKLRSHIEELGPYNG